MKQARSSIMTKRKKYVAPLPTIERSVHRKKKKPVKEEKSEPIKGSFRSIADLGIDLGKTRKQIIANRNENFRVEIRKNTDHPYYPDECEIRFTTTRHLWHAWNLNEEECKQIASAMAKHYGWTSKTFKRFLKRKENSNGGTHEKKQQEISKASSKVR